METRHNTQALEEALAQILRKHDAKIEASKSPVVLASAGARTSWLGKAAAISIVILATALAFRLINLKEAPTLTQPDYSSQAKQSSPVPDEKPKAASDVSPHKVDVTKPSYVTTNFTIFKNVSTLVGGKAWEVTAGHAFANQEDQANGNWQNAWCYFRGEKGKLSAQIVLGDRTSVSSSQTPPDFDPLFVESLGLSSGDIENMANKCPWLDGKSFNVSVVPFAPPPQDVSAKPMPGVASEITEVPLTNDAASQTAIKEDLIINPGGGRETVGVESTATGINRRLLSVVGFDAPEGDFPNMPIRGISQSDCEAACQKDQACNLATYNSKYSACYLKSALSRLKAYGGAVTFYRPDLSTKMIELTKFN